MTGGTEDPPFDAGKAFDAGKVFDEDYLHFHRRELDERADAETDLIRDLLDAPAGAEVLDLACGHGRIANRLAERGYRVTGLDESASFLGHAREDARARGVEVGYATADMRELPHGGEFDAVVNWFTSFGYFDDPGNRAVLAEVFRVLRPGGRFLLELNNYAWILRHYRDALVVEQDGDLLVDRNHLDPLTNQQRTERTLIRDGRVRNTRFRVRMLTFPEIRDWLLDAGFVRVRGLGEDGAALTAEHRRMIVLAQR